MHDAQVTQRVPERPPARGRPGPASPVVLLLYARCSYFAYHAVPTNARRMSSFRHYVVRSWLWALRRRSQKDSFSWDRIKRLADHWLPTPRVLHPWPDRRFAVTHPRSEPGA